jgi:outer membrane protein, heavy metal efflux system
MKRVFFCSALCVLLGVDSGLAQDAAIPQRLSLDAALKIADERSPLLASARALVGIAAADAVAAGARPNPALSFQSEGYRPFTPDPLWNGQEMYIRFEQEIEMAGRKRLRLETAGIAKTVAQASFDDERRRLHLDVRRAYFQLVLARADQGAAQASLAEIDKVIVINRQRFEQGEISGGDMRRIQVERLRFMDDVFSAELAVRNARAALLSLLNAPQLNAEVEPTEELRAPDLGPAILTAAIATAGRDVSADQIAQALAQRPDVAAARAQVSRAESETRLQRALRTPNVTLGGGYRRDFGVSGVLLGVTVPLPLFDRNAGQVARADAERQLAASRVAATQAAVALDVQQATNAVDVSRARVGYIEQEYLQNAREARDIVQASYGAGESALLDFLDAQRAYRETQRTYNRALYDYRVSLFQLEAAVGR